MQTEKVQMKKSKRQVNWKKITAQVGIPLLQGAAFAMGGLIVGRLANQGSPSNNVSDGNILPLRKTV